MNNLEKLQALLSDEMDGILLTSSVSRMYCARYCIDEGVCVVGRGGSRYFTDMRYIEAAENNLQGFEVQMIDRQHPYNDRINQALVDLGIHRLGIEEDYLTLGEYNAYHDALHAELIPCQKQLAQLRVVKDPWELDRMRKAQEITDASFTQILEKIHPGMTEKELAAELIYTLYRNGADGLSFAPIVVSGPNTSMPHGVPGWRKLQKGDFVTMDFGVLYQGYCSDMTRTVALGEATEKMRDVYNTVLQAQLTGIAATHEGMRGCDVDAAARAVIEQAGYGPYFGHSYGHSLGLEIHEAPNCAPSCQVEFPAGAVCSAEPGIYIPGEFGVRIEDVVIFKPDGCEVLTKSPKNLIIL